MKPARTADKVLVLGMDGLDPGRVAKMISAGQLPTFAELQHRGRLCALATSNPAESPVAWSSLATGCNPGKHGIFDFIHRKPSGYVPYLSLLREQNNAARIRASCKYTTPRQMPGFWQYTSEAGLPTTVIRWPVTFPAERVKGNFLAGLGVPDVSERLGKHTVYTTAPQREPGDKVVSVRWRGSRIVTDLFGPPVSALGRPRPLRAKLVIERTADGVAVTVGDQRCALQPGEWSMWFKARFRWGLFPVCTAVFKFHLISAQPELNLFVTPLQIDPERQIWPLTQPESYGTELVQRLGCFYTLGLAEDTTAVTDNHYDLDAFLHQCDDIDRERRAMFEHELNRFSEGLLAFVFDAGDRIQHMFWSIDDPQSPTFDAARARKYRNVVSNLYVEMDELLSEALQAAGDDTAVFVVSDHGFGPFRRAVNLNRWLVDSGYMKLKAETGRTLFADVDWARTTAYAVGFTSIYLNLAGRESQGTVSAGRDADLLLVELANKLREARDPQHGEKMIRDAYLAEDIYSGPHVAVGPDLVVGFEPGYRASWESVLGGAPTDVVVDNDRLWAADHLVDPSAVPGLLATNVPVTTAAPAGIDLAPTILSCFDLPIPASLDGSSWLRDQRAGGEVEPEPEAERPAKDLETGKAGSTRCAGVARADDPSDATDSDGLTDEQRAAIESRLRDLGYL